MIKKGCRWATACLLAIGLAGTAVAASPHERIQARMKAMGEAARAHDAKAFMQAFAHSPDLVFVVNGRVIHGYDALLAQQEKWWRHGASDVRYKPDGPTLFQDLTPGLVLTTSRMTSRRTGADGKVQTGSFAVSDLWKLRNGAWHIVYAHESTAH